eukprot:8292-Heterococcus_DN1.PRE.1
MSDLRDRPCSSLQLKALYSRPETDSPARVPRQPSGYGCRHPSLASCFSMYPIHSAASSCTRATPCAQAQRDFAWSSLRRNIRGGGVKRLVTCVLARADQQDKVEAV